MCYQILIFFDYINLLSRKSFEAIIQTLPICHIIIVCKTKMLSNNDRIHFIKIKYKLYTKSVHISHCLIPIIQFYFNLWQFFEQSKLFIEMNAYSILLLIAMSAISIEKSAARYLLIGIDDANEGSKFFFLPIS